MKRLFSFSVTSTFTFLLSILAILVIAVSAPGVVQAMLGPTPTSSGDVQPGNSIMASSYYEPKVNPAANFGSLTDNGTAAYMGIGISTPVSPLHIYSTTSTQPETIDLDGAQPITAQWNDYSNTGGAFSGSGFLARFAKGSKTAPVNVTNGDRLGFNVFGGWVGSWFHTAAIEALVDNGTVSGTSLPTYMRFSTTDNGSVIRSERMRIDSAGNIGINTTSPTAKLEVNGSVKITDSINRQPTNPPLFRWLPVKVLAAYTGTGASPRGIAFDGTNMWTANQGATSVTKFSPTGDNKTYTGTGASPIAIAFDGTNMWTANQGDSSVTKINPAGVTENYTGTGVGPVGIAFDGTNMWTANYNSNSVTVITPTGVMTTYTGTGTGPRGIAFDGTNMWTANMGSNSVTKITSAGAMTTYPGTGSAPAGIAFDGTNMWTANNGDNSVTKVTSAGAMTPYPGTGATPRAIAFDGTNMWTANSSANSVTKITPTGVMTPYTGTGADPEGIAFDGTNMWTTNYGANSVTKILIITR